MHMCIYIYVATYQPMYTSTYIYVYLYISIGLYAYMYLHINICRLCINIQLWHGVDRCFRLIQRAEEQAGQRYQIIVRARPDIMINGLSRQDFTLDSPAAHTILVPATPKQARWAHITDVFAVGPRDKMAAYMTMFRHCLYSVRAPLYDTHPRWDSEEKLEQCLRELGVSWKHVAHWRQKVAKVSALVDLHFESRMFTDF